MACKETDKTLALSILTTGALPANLSNQIFADVLARSKAQDQATLEMQHTRLMLDRLLLADIGRAMTEGTQAAATRKFESAFGEKMEEMQAQFREQMNMMAQFRAETAQMLQAAREMSESIKAQAAEMSGAQQKRIQFRPLNDEELRRTVNSSIGFTETMAMMPHILDVVGAAENQISEDDKQKILFLYAHFSGALQ